MRTKPNQPQIALALLATLFILVTLGTVSTVTAQDLTCRPTVSVGFVANFTQEVMKGQWPLSVEGIRRPACRIVRPQ
jgi:hypothetical protein